MELDARPTATNRLAALEAAPVAVSVDGAHKVFRIPHHQSSTLKEKVIHPLRTRAHDDFHAIDDISLGVKRGEFFGIVGRNGSGKSTLLKCIAGIYKPDKGSITLHGRLSPFIELGVGFNPDLTARDNVVINAVMMGLTRKEAAASFEAVLEFA